jgi:hypothetical protein
MRDSPVIVFAGPCLPKRLPASWRTLLAQVDLRPPAQRGDVLAALCDHPDTLVLLDGYYDTVPSVTHKELLYAIESGVRVIGAASMGALRAAELEHFGMLGVGCIFDLFRTGEIDGDDEVAILHAPEHLGYEPVTLALVELRLAIRALVAGGWITDESGARFIGRVKTMSFRDRRRARLKSLARRAFGRAVATRLARILRRQRLKEADARRALEVALTPAARPGPHVSSETTFLYRLKEQTIRAPSSRPVAERPTVLQSWFTAQLFHPDCARFVTSLRLRHLLFSEGACAGLRIAPERHESVVSILRACHERRFGSAWLPLFEYDEEARIHTMAEAAWKTFGDDHSACASLARRLGMGSRDAKARLLHLLEGQPDALPSWWQARAFTFTDAMNAAQDVAFEARAVFRCFLRWSGGASARWSSLVDVAASIWCCDRAGVFAEGARRGLFLVPAASEGLREALELVAAAERLPVPINQYPHLRQQLQRTPLRFVLEVAGTPEEEPARGLPFARGAEAPLSPLHDSIGSEHGRRPSICNERLYAVPASAPPTS